MFEQYSATKQDFLAIEETLQYVWHPKLDFVFRKKKPIRSTIVISYDSKHIYFWAQRKFAKITHIPCSVKNYFAYKTPHHFIFSEEHHNAWYAGVNQEIDALLPEEIKRSSTFSVPRISGGLLKPFITLQKSLPRKHNPYITRQSYLATIVHEFGHVYWNHYKLWWYSNKEKNLEYLRAALRCFSDSDKEPPSTVTRLNFPINGGIGEAYAVCTEFAASSLFWPTHKKALDTFTKYMISKAIQSECRKDLEREDSVLEPSRDPHLFGFAVGKLLLTKFPRDWPSVLTRLRFRLTM